MALWKVGRRSFLVEHRLASGEQWLTDTDQAMAEYGPVDPVDPVDPDDDPEGSSRRPGGSVPADPGDRW